MFMERLKEPLCVGEEEEEEEKKERNEVYK